MDTSSATPRPTGPHAAPRFIAHRFGRGLGPDSSRAALVRALRLPIAGVETDCCLAADGELLLLHDPLLDRSTTIGGWAHETPSRAILDSALRSSAGRPTGQHPLLLQAALDLIADHDIIVQLEVKAWANAALARQTAEAVCEVVAEWAPRATASFEVISFWPSACQIAASRGISARLIVACAYLPSHLADWCLDLGITGVILEAAYFADEPVDAWRDAGLSIMSGVINDVRDLGTILPYGPDYISTDCPDFLNRAWRSS